MRGPNDRKQTTTELRVKLSWEPRGRPVTTLRLLPEDEKNHHCPTNLQHGHGRFSSKWLPLHPYSTTSSVNMRTRRFVSAAIQHFRGGGDVFVGAAQWWWYKNQVFWSTGQACCRTQFLCFVLPLFIVTTCCSIGYHLQISIDRWRFVLLVFSPIDGVNLAAFTLTEILNRLYYNSLFRRLFVETLDVDLIVSKSRVGWKLTWTFWSKSRCRSPWSFSRRWPSPASSCRIQTRKQSIKKKHRSQNRNFAATRHLSLCESVIVLPSAFVSPNFANALNWASSGPPLPAADPGRGDGGASVAFGVDSQTSPAPSGPFLSASFSGSSGCSKGDFDSSAIYRPTKEPSPICLI